ncbi:MAG: hypothetical protein AAF597_10540, partial [Bacteroidota bacterium]
EFIQRFKDREEPEGDFGTEDLWADIQGELGQEDLPGAPWWKNWLGVGLGIALLSLALIGWWQLTPTPQTTLAQAPETQQELPGYVADDVPDTTTTAKNEDQPATDPVTTTENGLVATEAAVMNNPKASLEASNQPLQTPTKATAPATEQTTLGSASEPNNDLTSAGQAPGNTDMGPAAVTELADGSETAQKTKDALPPAGANEDNLPALGNEAKLFTIPLLTADLMSAVEPFPIELPTVNLDFPESPEPIPFKKQVEWGLTIGATAGINTTIVQLENANDPMWQNQRNQTEGAAAGAEGGLTIAVHKGNLRMTSGLNLIDSWRTFNFAGLVDTSRQLTNVLLSVVVDPETGQVIDQQFGDTLVVGQTFRRVQHFNNYRLLNVPLTLGYEKSFNRWLLGLHAGVDLQWLRQQSGRAQDAEGNIITFGNSSPEHLYQRFSLGLRLDGNLGYALTERLSLVLRPGVGRSWQQLPDNQRASIWSLRGNIGLRYRLR